MARLYADENFPRPVSEKLRSLGHDVLTCQESGRAGQGIEDDAVLAYAVSEWRAVLTINRMNFKRLHENDASHFGIIICTRNDNFAQQAQRIHEKITATPTLAGQLVRVYRPG